jgi:hypothetical protein
MQSALSAKSKMSCHEAAGLFGAALAVKNSGNVRLFGYADGVFEHAIPRGASVLKVTQSFLRRNGEVGWGTQTIESVRKTVSPHARRVLVFTDGQAFPGMRYSTIDTVVPKNAWLYGFNLAGYVQSMMPSGSGTRHELGGLSDATFKMIPLIEKAHTADWPWNNK